MAYPTLSAGYSLASSSGVTTLLWGTDGLLATPSPGGTFAGTGFYIVESVDQETDAEQIYIENGTGQKAARIIINHGQKWTLSVQDDTTMTPPTVGGVVTVVDGANLLGGGRIGIASCKVISSGERFSRKGAAMRNITVEKLTLVDY
jgi:hypothetical protein